MLVSSELVAAISMSQSSMPALRSVAGCAAWPGTMRRSTVLSSASSASTSVSITVTSLPSSARLRATVEPTWPAPSTMILTARRPGRPRPGRPCRPGRPRGGSSRTLSRSISRLRSFLYRWVRSMPTWRASSPMLPAHRGQAVQQVAALEVGARLAQRQVVAQRGSGCRRSPRARACGRSRAPSTSVAPPSSSTRCTRFLSSSRLPGQRWWRSRFWAATVKWR